MLQFILTLLPLLAAIAAAYTLACKVKHSGASLEQMLYDFGWCIDRSPAQVAFFMFSITAAIAASLPACFFFQLSKQFILTLDILFFISSLLLILYHQLKEYALTSVTIGAALS